MATAVDDEAFTTSREDGQWWCYYAGLATTGISPADAKREMRKWLAERNPESPTYSPDA